MTSAVCELGVVITLQPVPRWRATRHAVPCTLGAELCQRGDPVSRGGGIAPVAAAAGAALM